MGSLHHADLSSQAVNLIISDSSEDGNNIMNLELHKAAKAGNVNSFTATLDKIIEEKNIPISTIFNHSSHLKNTVIHVAASYGNTNLVQHLLDQYPDFLNHVNSKGDTALHLAAREGHLNVVKTLSIGDDIESAILASSPVMNEVWNTPLHEAMIHGHQTVVDHFLGILISRDQSAFFVNNKEGKSPLYLAVEAGNLENVKTMLMFGLSRPFPDRFFPQITGSKSLSHAAIAGRNLDLLQEITNVNSELVYFKDEEQQNSLHCAASIGFLEGVKYLLENFGMDAFEKDKYGFCPIHVASKNGHVDIIQYFLRFYPDPREFLNGKGQNILHVAAENGKHVAVKSILKSPGAKLLLNERDNDGNTCLHLATINSHPKVVSSLTWDKRVNLKLANNSGVTALEVAESMEVMPPFRQRLTWMALISAGAARAKVQDTTTVNRLKAAKYEPYSMDYCKDRVNTLLLVSALVATVTFAAGFTMPGGSNNSNTNQGMVTALHNINLIIFVVCDSLALFSSIIVVVILMWAQLGDLQLLLNALRLAQKFLGFSLTMMIVAFMVSVHLVLAKLVWLGVVVLTMGILSVMSLLALFIPLFLPYMSNFRVARYISYYPFYLLMMAS